MGSRGKGVEPTERWFVGERKRLDGELLGEVKGSTFVRQRQRRASADPHPR